MRGRDNPSQLARPKFPQDTLSPLLSLPSSRVPKPQRRSSSHSLREPGEQILGEGRAVFSELNLAGGKGLILHDHSAAASQDQDVQLLLLLMSLLVPLARYLRVMGRDQSHLGGKGDMPGVIM